MKPKTFYFSHDFNSRMDEKIRSLLMRLGMKGYGIYWSIVEDLYNNGNVLKTDFETIAFYLRENIEDVKSVICDFNLFVIEGDTFGSLSIQKRIDERNEKSKVAKEVSYHRWNDGKRHQRQKAEQCLLYGIRIFNNEEEFIKIGITTESISRRYSGKLSNYDYEVLFTCENSCENCLNLEGEIHKNFKVYAPKTKFAGYLECLHLSDYETIIDFAMRNETFRNAQFNFRNAIKERKGKERKRKEKKGNKPSPNFENSKSDGDEKKGFIILPGTESVLKSTETASGIDLTNENGTGDTPIPTGKKKSVKTKKNEDTKTHTEIMELYSDWMESRNLPARIDASDAAAVKKIVSYLSKFEKVQSGERTVLDLLKYIFDNWNNLPAWNQNQTQLRQINSQLPTIIEMIKNKTNGTSKQTNHVETFTRLAEAMRNGLGNF